MTMTPQHPHDPVAATLTADAPNPWGAVVPPIAQTSLFTFASYEAMAARFAGETSGPIYSRGDNPTVMEFEAKLAALEGAEAARGFASGMAAISAAILSVVKAGDRMLCVRHVYPDAYRFMEKLLPRLGVRVEYVDGSDPAAVAAALPGAALLYLESPSSWVMQTQPLRELCALARQHGVVTICDNSWATPVFQRPLDCGVDLVVHSASKYLSGHSDTVAGVVAGSSARIAALNDLVYPYLGAKLAPMEAWLLVRGMRTLQLRMQHHAAAAATLIERLRAHPGVTAVLHPSQAPAAAGNASLRGFSSLFSLELAPHLDVPAFCNALKLFRIGVSWGGHESLVFPSAIGRAQNAGPNPLLAFDVSGRLVRLYIGLEGVDDLWDDLQQALASARRP